MEFTVSKIGKYQSIGTFEAETHEGAAMAAYQSEHGGKLRAPRAYPLRQTGVRGKSGVISIYSSTRGRKSSQLMDEYHVR